MNLGEHAHQVASRAHPALAGGMHLPSESLGAVLGRATLVCAQCSGSASRYSVYLSPEESIISSRRRPPLSRGLAVPLRGPANVLLGWQSLDNDVCDKSRELWSYAH